jgi:hypothetical protein
MKRAISLLGVLAGFVVLSSHDLYLKLDSFFLDPNTNSVLQLYNGTFDRSENVIDRDRMIDVSIVRAGERLQANELDWFEKDSITYLNIKTEAEGTYVAGVSTKPRVLSMSADDFNDYLEHDGVLDVLESRRQSQKLNDSATEQYSKHVKTLFQVGKQRSLDYKVQLGYPIEFVALNNPYELKPGDQFSAQLFFQGKPLVDQLVYLGYQPQTVIHTHDGSTHTHADDSGHEHSELVQLRTDENGVVFAKLDQPGVWYLRTIHLVESKQDDLTHESNWATLSFALADDHNHDRGDTAYIYILVSLLIIGALYFIYRKKNA